MEKVAIIGGGPAGLVCAITAKRKNHKLDITIFEKTDIGHTILPTGGGRCNITHKEDDIKAFAQNYPRGEKFLYSIFNQFFVDDTIGFFKSIGIETYVQEDNRIFPVSNKSLDVIFALKNEVKKLHIKVKKAEVTDIKYKDFKFIIDNESFDKLVISTGGRKQQLLKSIENLGQKIIEQRPAICGLKIKEKYFSEISGVTLKNIKCIVRTKNKNVQFKGDLLFTHKGISGPVAYRISSLFLNQNYSEKQPLEVTLNFMDNKTNLQSLLEKNSKKKVYNLLSDFIPKSLVKLLLQQYKIEDKCCYEIRKEERKILEDILFNLKLNITGYLEDAVIVHAGGIDLNGINPKTMKSKVIDNLFFCGEVINVDGLCGGFNLQNCWSTGYVAGIHM